MPASPVVLETQLSLANSDSVAVVSLSTALQAGDVVQVGADTNNGAQVTSVTSSGLTFVKLATGFSLSVWSATVPSTMAAPTMTLTYSPAFNTTTIIAALIRGSMMFDPNNSLPGVEVGNPAPPPVVFSTDFPDDLLLLWFGMFVGFGSGPWEDPLIAPPNTVGPGTWNWENGANNTSLLQPIALALYSSTVSSAQTNAVVSSSSSALQGAAYIVLALSSNQTSISVSLDDDPVATSDALTGSRLEGSLSDAVATSDEFVRVSISIGVVLADTLSTADAYTTPPPLIQRLQDATRTSDQLFAVMTGIRAEEVDCAGTGFVVLSSRPRVVSLPAAFSECCPDVR